MEGHSDILLFIVLDISRLQFFQLLATITSKPRNWLCFHIFICFLSLPFDGSFLLCGDEVSMPTVQCFKIMGQLWPVEVKYSKCASWKVSRFYFLVLVSMPCKNCNSCANVLTRGCPQIMSRTDVSVTFWNEAFQHWQSRHGAHVCRTIPTCEVGIDILHSSQRNGRWLNTGWCWISTM